jgi:dihydropteroate synthase
VIEAVRRGHRPPISVDTTLAVARAALDAGADAINDVSGGDEDPGWSPRRRRGCGLS